MKKVVLLIILVLVLFSCARKVEEEELFSSAKITSVSTKRMHVVMNFGRIIYKEAMLEHFANIDTAVDVSAIEQIYLYKYEQITGQECPERYKEE